MAFISYPMTSTKISFTEFEFTFSFWCCSCFVFEFSFIWNYCFSYYLLPKWNRKHSHRTINHAYDCFVFLGFVFSTHCPMSISFGFLAAALFVVRFLQIDNIGTNASVWIFIFHDKNLFLLLPLEFWPKRMYINLHWNHQIQ